MNLYEAAVLALVQGFTEFLPISSSGHTILASWLFGWDAPSLNFEIATHLGTMAAVIVYFRRDWITIGRQLFIGGSVLLQGEIGPEIGARRLLTYLVLGSVPIGLVGLIFRNVLEVDTRQPVLIGCFLLGTAMLLVASEKIGQRKRHLHSLDGRTTLVIGLAQALAVLPGVSRSAMSMSAGLISNMTRDSAVRFSFLLALPAIFGAGLVLTIELALVGDKTGDEVRLLAFATAVSFVTALVAMRSLLSLLRRVGFWPFAIYCSLVGVLVIAAWAAGA